MLTSVSLELLLLQTEHPVFKMMSNAVDHLHRALFLFSPWPCVLPVRLFITSHIQILLNVNLKVIQRQWSPIGEKKWHQAINVRKSLTTVTACCMPIICNIVYIYFHLSLIIVLGWSVPVLLFSLNLNETLWLVMSLLSCLKTCCSILCNQISLTLCLVMGLQRLGPHILASNEYYWVSFTLSHALVICLSDYIFVHLMYKQVNHCAVANMNDSDVTGARQRHCLNVHFYVLSCLYFLNIFISGGLW